MEHAPRRNERPPSRRRHVVARVIWSGVVSAATVAVAGPPSTKDREFFETRIRPVLISHCYECHGPESQDLGGGLRLDHRDGLQRGGQSGAAIVAGTPDKSLLIHALRYAGPEMPPEAPLPEPVIRDFEEWVRRGAPDPRETVASTAITTTPTAPRSDLWSLQPVADPQLPAVQGAGWPRDPLDHFVLARIETVGLAPTHDAPSRTLVRRLFVDLLGLPPTAAEIEAFETAHAVRGEAAVGTLVDDLLARPQFGERWARHWLDVARYGESNGNDGLGRNPTFPHAWRYRDYCIAAFNADMPFNRFITEQIAGDLLGDEPIEGHVGVEGGDAVVAISPRMRKRRIATKAVVAVGFSVTGHVEPVSSPAFAELRPGEQVVDECAHGSLTPHRVRRLEGFDLGGRRRQPEKIDEEPTDERAGWRVVGGCEPHRLDPRKHEVVERITWPAGSLHSRQLRISYRLERPKVGPRGRRRRGDCSRRHRLPRIGSPASHPLLEITDHRLGQWSFRWHLRARIPQRMDQQALVRSSRHDRGPGLPTPLQPIAVIEPQAATEVLRLWPMALVAVRDQHRPDSRLEKLTILGRGRSRDGHRGSRDDS